MITITPPPAVLSLPALRLVSWNILEGFRVRGRDVLDRDRLAAARRMLDRLEPDILVLNEALGCEHLDYAGMLGFPYQEAAQYDGDWGNVILSRFPLAGAVRMSIYNRGGLRAIALTPQGLLTVATYHPHPSRYPDNKATDYASLVAGVSGPLVVCGDMNAINPEDRPDFATLAAGFRRFAKTPEADVARFVDGGAAVFEAVAALGLYDAVPAEGRRYSMPTDLVSTVKDSAMRIDHVLVNDAVTVRGGEVVHAPDADRASDHYPVCVDFHLPD